MSRNIRHELFFGLFILGVLVVLLMVAFPSGGGTGSQKTVVVYTSVDQVYSEPVLSDFGNRTGIRVLAVYDVEATKTTGLVTRLIAEKNRPQADVFWSGEFGQTILLKDQGVLVPYISPSSAGIPAHFIDPDYTWTGFGGRARVFLVNTGRLTPDRYPSSVYDMLDSRYPADSVGIAYPVFGTTATHAAALYSLLGNDDARAFFSSLNGRGVRVTDGNSVVRDLVADGQLAFGLTDTDDACGAVERGDPVAIVIPDQDPGEMGTLVIPNTVALVKGAPHPSEGKALIDYLLDKKTEEALVASGWIQVPGREVAVQSTCLDLTGIRTMNVSYYDVYTGMPAARQDLTTIFIR